MRSFFLFYYWNKAFTLGRTTIIIIPTRKFRAFTKQNQLGNMIPFVLDCAYCLILIASKSDSYQKDIKSDLPSLSFHVKIRWTSGLIKNLNYPPDLKWKSWYIVIPSLKHHLYSLFKFSIDLFRISCIPMSILFGHYLISIVWNTIIL